jgi:hypothetical protein
MTITSEQWKEVEKELYGSYGTVKLKHQANELTLNKILIAENKLAIAVYINGQIKPSMGHPDFDSFDQCTEQYWHRKTKAKYPPSRQKSLLKIWGKRELKNKGVDLESKHIWYDPCFTKFNPLKAQFKKLNDLEITSIGYQQDVA